MKWVTSDQATMIEAAKAVVYGDEPAPVYCEPQDTHECICHVEPDGYCQHGCPSILFVFGVI